MPTDRNELLRILASLDQSLAKVESVIEHSQSYSEWQDAVGFRDKLQASEMRVQNALRQMSR